MRYAARRGLSEVMLGFEAPCSRTHRKCHFLRMKINNLRGDWTNTSSTQNKITAHHIQTTRCKLNTHVALPNDVVCFIRRLHVKHLALAHMVSSRLLTVFFCIAAWISAEKRFRLNDYRSFAVLLFSKSNYIVFYILWSRKCLCWIIKISCFPGDLNKISAETKPLVVSASILKTKYFFGCFDPENVYVG